VAQNKVKFTIHRNCSDFKHWTSIDEKTCVEMSEVEGNINVGYINVFDETNRPIDPKFKNSTPLPLSSGSSRSRCASSPILFFQSRAFRNAALGVYLLF